MRLIDADALLEALKDNGTYLLRFGADQEEFILYSEAIDLITNAPTVQREPPELKAHINRLREALEEISSSTDELILLPQPNMEIDVSRAIFTSKHRIIANTNLAATSAQSLKAHDDVKD